MRDDRGVADGYAALPGQGVWIECLIKTDGRTVWRRGRGRLVTDSVWGEEEDTKRERSGRSFLVVCLEETCGSHWLERCRAVARLSVETLHAALWRLVPVLQSACITAGGGCESGGEAREWRCLILKELWMSFQKGSFSGGSLCTCDGVRVCMVCAETGVVSWIVLLERL